MADAVRWGIVSTAHINGSLIPGAKASPKVQLVGVASRDQARADEYAREHGIERGYGSYEALLADPDVEAVYISLPNQLHHEWTARALDAGKHVLCEKPLTRHATEAEELFDLAERNGVLLSEAFMYRHNPQTKRLSELVGEGVVGELRLVRAAFGFALFDHDNIRLREDADGGSLMDVGCYCVSGARLVAGEPERVHAEAWYGPSGTDWVAAATMRFPGDVVGLFDCGTAVDFHDALEVAGTEGTLFLDDPWFCRTPVIELRRGGDVERIELPRSDSYRLELENLSDAIRGEAPLLLGREDGVAQARALEAVYESAKSGQPVTL